LFANGIIYGRNPAGESASRPIGAVRHGAHGKAVGLMNIVAGYESVDVMAIVRDGVGPPLKSSLPGVKRGCQGGEQVIKNVR